MFYEVEVIVGHNSSNGGALPAQQVATIVNEGLLAFAHFFGGAYALAGIGSYLNDEDFAFTEPATLLKVYTLNVDNLKPYLPIFAGEIADALHQECVALVIKEVQGTLEFVKPIHSRLFLLERQPEPVRSPANTEETVVVPFNLIVHQPANS